MIQRRIKKHNEATAKMQMRGGSSENNSSVNENYTVPQHGHSCKPDEINCPGNDAAVMLAAKNQMTANAHGDSLSH